MMRRVVVLVRRALRLEDELIPYRERIQRRYAQWLADQQAGGIIFTPEQRWWLDRIADQIGLNLTLVGSKELPPAEGSAPAAS